MRPLEVVSKRFRSFDDAELLYHVTPGQGPWVVLVNGLGARFTVWHHQVDYLRDHYRFLTWDYRGLYDSEGAQLPSSKDAVQAHAADMAAVLRAEGIDNPVCIGWSMGVQVMLEAMRSHDVRPSHLVMVNGTFGRSSRRRAIDWVHPFGYQALLKLEPLLSAVAKRAGQWPETASWFKRLGIVGPTIDEEALAEVASTFAEVNVGAYLRTLLSLRDHDVESLLGAIDVPTLVVAGQRDAVTPGPVAERVARRIPGAELFLIRGATHYAGLEFPELLNLRIEKFFRENNI